MADTIKAFRATAKGVDAIVYATTAGRARTAMVRSATDAGYAVGYRDVRVRRDRAFDGRPKIAAAYESRGTCWEPARLARELGITTGDDHG